MKNQRKIILTFTLIVFILASTTPTTVQAKRKVTRTIETIPLGNGITMFKEYIPISSDLTTQILQEEGKHKDYYYTVNVFSIEIPVSPTENTKKHAKHRKNDDTIVILIDAGDQKLSRKLLKAVRKTTGQKPDAVYLTHYHSDHAGGGRYFQKKKTAGETKRG